MARRIISSGTALAIGMTLASGTALAIAALPLSVQAQS